MTENEHQETRTKKHYSVLYFPSAEHQPTFPNLLIPLGHIRDAVCDQRAKLPLLYPKPLLSRSPPLTVETLLAIFFEFLSESYSYAFSVQVLGDLAKLFYSL